jgi:hypothetical protein
MYEWTAEMRCGLRAAARRQVVERRAAGEVDFVVFGGEIGRTLSALRPTL